MYPFPTRGVGEKIRKVVFCMLPYTKYEMNALLFVHGQNILLANVRSGTGLAILPPCKSFPSLSVCFSSLVLHVNGHVVETI